MNARLAPLPSGATVVVIGGANTDLVGTPHAELVAAVSNPGSVRISAGGVGRNIAENLARLGVRTHLITAFGDDEASDLLRAWCMEAGIGVSHSVRVAGQPGARYLAINDGTHDLAAAVSDMRVLSELTPAELEVPGRRALIDSANLVILDTNLGADTIAWVVDNIDAPILVDPVSIAKVPRIADSLARLAAIKPNTFEAAALLGHEVTGLEEAEQAARELRARGVDRVFVTAGPAGVAWAGPDESGSAPAAPAHVLNSNGAGDAFTAGIAYGMLAGLPTKASALLGAAMSAATLAVDATVDPALSPERIASTIKETAL